MAHFVASVDQENHATTKQDEKSQFFCNGQIMAEIMSYLNSDVPSLAKLILVLDKQMPIIGPYVARLKLPTQYCACGFASILLKHLKHLRHFSISCPHGDNCIYRIMRAPQLPPSLYSIHLTWRHASSWHLLGTMPRSNLTRLSLQWHHIYLQDIKNFDFDNLLHLNLTNIWLPFNYENDQHPIYELMGMMETNFCNLHSLSLSLDNVPPLQSDATAVLDMSAFVMLKKLSLGLRLDARWPFDVTLPQQLESFSTRADILNQTFYTTPLLKLVKLAVYGSFVVKIPLWQLAPNLESIESSDALCQLAQLEEVLLRLPSLTTLGGNLLRDDPRAWRTFVSAIQNGKNISIGSMQDAVFLTAENCDWIPPFPKLYIPDSSHVLQMPNLSLCKANDIHICKPHLSHLQYMSNHATHLTKLRIDNLDLDTFGANYNITTTTNILPPSIRHLHLTIKKDCLGIQVLADIGAFINRCITPNLDTLIINHDGRHQLFRQLVKCGVAKVRAASLSLCEIFCRMPRLANFVCDLPIVDVDEQHFGRLNLDRLQKINVYTWRGEESCLDESHFYNINQIFLRSSVALCYRVIQPAWRAQAKNGTGTFTCIDDVPKCFVDSRKLKFDSEFAFVRDQADAQNAEHSYHSGYEEYTASAIEILYRTVTLFKK